MTGAVWAAHGKPDFLFFDIRPVQHPLLLVCSHEIAEQVSKSSKTQPYSVTKSPTVQGGLRRLIGKYSILSTEGEAWKSTRKIFNPGFAPQHLYSLLPTILDKTEIFIQRLEGIAKSGNAVEMETYCTDVTFDIIGQVVTDENCFAQDGKTGGNDIVVNFRKLIKEYMNDNGMGVGWLDWGKHVRKFLYGRRLDEAIKKCIMGKWAVLQAEKEEKQQEQGEKDGGQVKKVQKDRSVLALALTQTPDLSPHALQLITDQVKTFLFAGHDTTSILLQRLFYTLSIHPRVLSLIRAEHDSIFGDSDPRTLFLENPDGVLSALTYTAACIKEALRLWPPAGSARMSHNNFRIRSKDGEEVCIDKCVIYLCHYIIQRDESVFGATADEFVPERWLDVDTGKQDFNGEVEAEKQNAKADIPVSAFRPFERGPRNCIGQELANIEAKVILACTLRRFDFEKVGIGACVVGENGEKEVDEKGRYKTESELLNVSFTCIYVLEDMWANECCRRLRSRVNRLTR